jgi:large conductance mechanosensitive channel
MLKEFVAFLKHYGIIGLAIAVIIGGKLNELVGSFVNDILMPIVFAPALRAANVEDIKLLNFHGIMYGKFVGSFIDFLIVAFVVFLISKIILKEDLVAKK